MQFESVEMNKLNSASTDPSRDSELAGTVRKVMKQYFRDLDGEQPAAVYDMVLGTVERPLLEVVLAQTNGNQTRAAEILGINRNTLRKKLAQHGLE
jgi:Fis family transcriptional regulator, factor for inversion stimulation protein